MSLTESTVEEAALEWEVNIRLRQGYAGQVEHRTPNIEHRSEEKVLKSDER